MAELTQPIIVPYANLTERQKREILAHYIHRDTLDSPWNDFARVTLCKGTLTETDEEWIRNRTWQLCQDGRVRLVEERVKCFPDVIE